jgi:hypothetical protein
MGDDRKAEIMKMEFPKETKTMQLFLGSALFFKNFIINYSDLTANFTEMTHKDFNWDEKTWIFNYRGVQKLLVGYTKSICNLEGATLATFIHLKNLIDRSQNIFYFDIEEGDQIHLKTDASNYGIGAYLYILRKVR